MFVPSPVTLQRGALRLDPLAEADIPVLEFDVDPVDANTWDEAKFRTLVSDFIEQRVAPARARRTRTHS